MSPRSQRSLRLNRFSYRSELCPLKSRRTSGPVPSKRLRSVPTAMAARAPASSPWAARKRCPSCTSKPRVPHDPVVAIEIKDRKPDDWSPLLLEVWGDAMNDPAAWAKAAEAAGADVLQLTLSLTHRRWIPQHPGERRRRRESRARRSRLAADRLRSRQRRTRQCAARARGRSDQGRASRARHLRGQELSHHRRHGDGERSPRQCAHGDGRQPRQAVEHPHQRHGPAARSRPDGSDDGRARLRHRVRFLGDGAPAHGRAARRCDDATADDRHASARRRGRPKSPRSAKASRRRGASGTSAASTGKR